MAYKTKAEKRAYKTGLLNGLKRSKKPVGKNGCRRRSNERTARPNNPFGMSYEQMLREETQKKIDLLGDFDYDSRGRIKGSYTPDGFFEPD